MTANDIDRLTGAEWKGSLEYRDYTSGTQTTIPSNLKVQRLADTQVGPAWEFRLGYNDEPQANREEIATLAQLGREFRGERVIERAVDADDIIRIVTEQDGEDDNRPAQFRFVYRIGPTTVSIQKLVRFGPTEAYFERHIYRWTR